MRSLWERVWEREAGDLMSRTWLWKIGPRIRRPRPNRLARRPRWAADRFAHSAGPGISFWRIGVFVSGRSGWSSRVRQVATQNRSKSKNNENQFQEKSKNTNDFCIDFMAILAQFLEPSWLCFEIFFCDNGFRAAPGRFWTRT